jgi:hypothetical protein
VQKNVFLEFQQLDFDIPKVTTFSPFGPVVATSAQSNTDCDGGFGVIVDALQTFRRSLHPNEGVTR